VMLRDANVEERARNSRHLAGASPEQRYSSAASYFPFLKEQV
jgi:hypothetical protein